MDDNDSYLIAGTFGALAMGLTFYQVHMKPMIRFQRQSGLSLKKLNLTHAMKLDRLINVLNVSGISEGKKEELEETVSRLPLRVQTAFKEFKACYQHREEVAKALYRRPEVREYLNERED
ncbi:MAG: hypothetical protein AABW82_03355 [Nanoarchaeota archaeon]